MDAGVSVKNTVDDAKWKMHEFFAGSGLVGYGLGDLFDVVWANDISDQKAAVYTANFPSDRFHLGDIKDVDGSLLPHANMSWASFPCQDLSLAGSIGGIHASRSGLVWEWLRVYDAMNEKPKVVILENVVGLLSTNNGDNYRALHHALVDRGFVCGAVVLNASRFVPQSRPRVFVIAVQSNVALPQDVHSDVPCWLHNKAAKELGPSLANWVWWNAPEPPKRTTSLGDVIEPDVPYDKDAVLTLIPERHRVVLEAAKTCFATGYRRTRGGKQVLELRFDGIAGCLRTPAGGSSKQFLIVKENGEIHARLLTVREAARLMGAPDSFKLPGTYNDGYMAMGDAVAAPVARYLGEYILEPLVEAAYGMH